MKTRVALVLAALFVLVGAGTAARRSFVVRMYDLELAKPAVEVFRANGFRVDVVHDRDPKATDKLSDYPVIAVGSDVPVEEAIEVVRLARRSIATMRYVFIREDPEYAAVVYVGSHKDWIPYKKLKPLTEADFAAITAKGQTTAQFHANVRRFGL